MSFPTLPSGTISITITLNITINISVNITITPGRRVDLLRHSVRPQLAVDREAEAGRPGPGGGRQRGVRELRRPRQGQGGPRPLCREGEDLAEQRQVPGGADEAQADCLLQPALGGGVPQVNGKLVGKGAAKKTNFSKNHI